MDSLITAAARALAAGDRLGALKRVALRNDAPALAMRGIIMAQLGELDRAKVLLRGAARAFGPREVLARARCVVAEAEIALVSRDLSQSSKAIENAAATLTAHGDHINAAHAGNLMVRRLVLIGCIDEAERRLEGFDPAPLPPAWRAAHELVVAGIAIRRLDTRTAQTAFARARNAARAAGIPALAAEVDNAAQVMDLPAARRIACGRETPLRLADVERLLASGVLVVDACRNVVRKDGKLLSLATRPVLFALAREIAEAWPADVSRGKLVKRAFGGREADESHRARLRVEIGRLRAELGDLADIVATERGFALMPNGSADVAILAPPVDEKHSTILALLGDGESWSTSAISIALATSPRTVQRALVQLSEAGKVRSFGAGRARRWLTPSVPGFPTTLLLPGPLPGA